MVYILKVTGTLPLQHLANAPPGHRVSCTHTATIQLPQPQPSAGPAPHPFSVALLPSTHGSALVVASCADAAAAAWSGEQQHGCAARLHLFHRGASGSTAWALAATYEAPVSSGSSSADVQLIKAEHGGAAAQDGAAGTGSGPACLAVSADGCSVALLVAGRLHVLDTASLKVRQVRDGFYLPPSAAPGQACTRSVLCISPNAACVAVAVSAASEAPSTSSGVWRREAGASHGGTCNPGAGDAVLRVMTVPEAVTSQWPMKPEPEAAPEASVSPAVRLESCRMALAALTGRHAWDLAVRFSACAASGGSALAAEALGALDMLFAGCDDLCRTSYVLALDRVKAAVLQRLPGPVARAVAADIVARCLLRQRQPILTACNAPAVFGNQSQGAQGGAETGTLDKQARMEDLMVLQPWLSWAHSYFMLIMSSMRLLHQLPLQQQQQQQPGADDKEAALLGVAGRPHGEAGEGSDALPGLRLLQDAGTMQKLAQMLIAWKNSVRLLARPADLHLAAEQEALFKTFINMYSQPSRGEPHEPHMPLCGRGVFSGPYHLHIARPARSVASMEILKKLLPYEQVQVAPDMSVEELMHKARELGVDRGPGSGLMGTGGTSSATQAARATWQAWRQPRPALKSALLRGTLARPQLRQRWREQRASALLPLGSAAASGSRTAAAAALDTLPLLDVLSGKQLPWETASVVYECADAMFATAEFYHTAADGSELGTDTTTVNRGLARRSGAQRPGAAQAMMRKMWLGSPTPAGTMWKRLKVKHVPSGLAGDGT